MRGGSATVTGAMTSYTIEGLEEHITYSITVTATNNLGYAISEIVTVRTSDSSKVVSQMTNNCVLHGVFYYLQLLLVLPLPLVLLVYPPASLSSGGQLTASTAMEI